LRDVCDTVHVLMLARVERETLAVRTGLIAAGAEELPTVEEAQANFTAALAALPEARSASSLMRERLKVAV